MRLHPSVPAEMTAIGIDGGRGPARVLRPVTLPVPYPEDGEVLIRVRAAGINRPDLFQRKGAYPPPPGAPETLGLEVAGEVAVAAGRWRVGDRVCALLGGGGYAEYARCDARHLLPLPASLSWVEGAALPETMLTVFANVFEDGKLAKGERLLVHGANSGIGITAIQMARAHGATVIATVRGKRKAARVAELGADLVIDVEAEDFADIVSQSGGADVVLEMMGGDYVAKDLTALNSGGRIVFIAGLAGMEPHFSIWMLMQKRALLTGSTLRGRSGEEKALLMARLEYVAWPWVGRGEVRPLIDRCFPLACAAEAHAHLESGSHIGKVVLAVD